MREIFFRRRRRRRDLRGDRAFESAIKAGIWRFAGELWQVTSQLAVLALPFRAAPIIVIP
ncbi:hypothetical protein CIT26_27255 [Mesorhizobium temperatum]|uniref:Uncharacterized protein n=1 Tax=Mesorhizobium temperatum TaxID=241416 RepID=A0A271LF81_9HYPH|nr:hypothetical protein CIT26_27255 [Mesorhizobium temperatum]